MSGQHFVQRRLFRVGLHHQSPDGLPAAIQPCQAALADQLRQRGGRLPAGRAQPKFTRRGGIVNIPPAKLDRRHGQERLEGRRRYESMTQPPAGKSRKKAAE
jgi:hypothetical protein